MAAFKLSARSMGKLEGVHGDLQRVVKHAIQITEIDFGVTEGLRSPEKQEKMFASGASKTMNSRHLTGHAVDLVAYLDGKVAWDWPLYDKIALAMKAAADCQFVQIKWGGDWKFKDGPHFQLRWRDYPIKKESV